MSIDNKLDEINIKTKDVKKEYITLEISAENNNHKSVEVLDSITVITNDPKQNVIKFLLKAKMRNMVEVVPSKIFFGYINKGQTKKITVRLINKMHDNNQFTVKRIITDRDIIETKYQQINDDLYEIEFAINPSNVMNGAFSGTINILGINDYVLSTVDYMAIVR